MSVRIRLLWRLSRFLRPTQIIIGLIVVALACSCSTTAMAGPSATQENSAPLEPVQAASAVDLAASESVIVTAEPSSHDVRSVSRGMMLVASFTVFLLAIFVGFEVITKVPPTLHTPLMSGSNAISGITVVGAMLTAGNAVGGFGAVLGMVAVVLAFINVVGGFLVTHRMLKMFKKG